ncbi:transposase [uncultured Selenomonas sp.]|uniref:transposase n=1 Tax=uncultured Selenomonas sp. TaxID=159275 RepID=UPI002627F193|nr:transposase [uncultured Selenomonas sp.]
MAKGRQYQDTVFRAYMNDVDRLRDVAGALHGRTYTSVERVRIVTLDGTFLSQMKNDISFLLAGRHLVFMEHQSTLNQNMPLRCLYYLCEQLRQYIPAKSLYQNKQIPLPRPEFHVFYTGSKDTLETEQMRLSDAYMEGEGDIHLELKVTFHNIAYGSEKMLLRMSRPLHDYSFFLNCIKTNIAGGMERVRAIREAMRYCMEHDVMKEFLQEHESEVIDMVNFEWNQKDFEEAVREEGWEQGAAQGREEGREEEKSAFILGMLKEKLPLETIARVSKMSVERIQELGRMHSLL